MSKGNMLLGYARGKVGSLVFARRKGQQITRARNFSPANPRTKAQMAQRMRMYAAVKFYKQLREQFFDLAFPLKNGETVFNAFIRENIARSPQVSKTLAAASAPIPFPARMSSGGVTGYEVVQVETVGGSDANKLIAQLSFNESGPVSLVLPFVDIATGNQGATIGGFSRHILSLNLGLQEGDQITFVACKATGLSVNGGEVSYDNLGNFVFSTAKFVIDSTSTAAVSTIGLSASGLQAASQNLAWQPFSASDATDAVGAAVIVTRTSGGAVEASNSSLTLNTFATAVYEALGTDSSVSNAEDSYKATEDAYLNPSTSASAQPKV